MEVTIGNQHTRKIFFDGVSKECIKWGQIKSLSEFHKDTNKYGSAYYCKVCAIENSRKYHHRRIKEDPTYKEAKRNGWLKLAHGISLKQYREKLASQNHECAICRIKLSDSGQLTHLDHDHKTGKLRDFLCTNCNRGLGHFKDNVNFLQTAIDYLNFHNTSVDSVEEVTNDVRAN